MIGCRFGPSELDDFTGELINLHQTGTVEEYQDQFEAILSKTRGISRDQRIALFLNGLKENIKSRVQICQPQTWNTAVCLARKYEKQWENQRRNWLQWIDRRRTSSYSTDIL